MFCLLVFILVLTASFHRFASSQLLHGFVLEQFLRLIFATVMWNAGISFTVVVVSSHLWCFQIYCHHRQPKLNIREPLNYEDLYANTTNLCKMEETNTVLSIKSTYPVSSSFLCHLLAFQAESKRFRRVNVIRVPTAKCNRFYWYDQ